MDKVIKRHLIWLIIIAVAFKLFTVWLTTSMFHSFFDVWDFGVYFDRAMQTSMGAVPYADYQFDYPPIALIPVFLAFLAWKVIPVFGTFVISFGIMMVICDIATILGIYAIAWHIWKDKNRAFVAGLLYACALPVAYFTLTRFDALPVMIMVWGILFMLKGEVMQSYFTMLIGFITKIFTILTIPYLIIWNSEKRDWFKDAVYIWILAAGILLLAAVPFMLGGAGIFDVFDVVHKTALHANTPIYLLHMYFGNLSTDLITYAGYAAAGIVFLLMLWYISNNKGNEVALLKTIMVVIVVAVLVAPQHSPQYVMWYMPFLCLLLSGDIIQIGALVSYQIMIYLEFPIFFNQLYDNGSYLAPVQSGWWTITVILFTAKYLLLVLLVYMGMNTESAGEPDV